MNKNNWRDELDMLINKNLDELLVETKEYDYAIKNANDKGKAQMWVALAIINSKLNNILLDKKKSESDSNPKIPKNELKKIIDTLETL